ncbi:hypothetical protein MIND_00946900 [Mycena indigotica]|uniref:Glycosyltransferase 61 catalytic domain-containing protein n=1 Tax=Mycena indigotica TaxID=2126181 RepID=A0A8H6SCR1_9AGAR|nr:uncharacterized protein MIND_00946900 [Mycena indigotica]KAF7297140.1 hypothetical protein MIND_00946900 [Mycena indigotica]
MGFAPPTAREILLVCILLVGLFILFFPDPRSQFASAPAPTRFGYNRSTAHSTPPPTQQNHFSTRLNWGKDAVPQTKVVAHAPGTPHVWFDPGWSIVDKLYVYHGVVFLVTDQPQNIPDLSAMYSKGLDIEVGEEAELARLPDENDIRIVSTTQAKKLFGSGAQILDGVTFLINDPPQFVRHFFHGVAELMFGLWRAYSSLDPAIPPSGNTSLPSPRRMWFNRLDAFRWRDYAEMNEWVIRAVFPDLTMEFIDDWDDRREMNSAFVLERVVLADRSAAMPGLNFQRYQRTASTAFGLPGSAYWWLTVRNNVVKFAGLQVDDAMSTMNRPVITYISRQSWGRRMLIQADHERLVKELQKIEATYGYELHVVEAEKMTKIEQIQLASRTTILMGVHGNGLTNLVWMKPTRRSTVIEFFYPGGFAHDYEWTSRSLGLTHYGVWGTELFTSPGIPLPSYPEGFQGNSIPLDGEAVARLCVQRLELEEDVDEG